MCLHNGTGIDFVLANRDSLIDMLIVHHLYMSPAAPLISLASDTETGKHRHKDLRNKITFSNTVQPTFCLY